MPALIIEDICMNIFYVRRAGSQTLIFPLTISCVACVGLVPPCYFHVGQVPAVHLLAEFGK